MNSREYKNSLEVVRKCKLRHVYHLIVSLTLVILAVNLRQSSNRHEKRYRRLNLAQFIDPKTVEVKDDSSQPPKPEWSVPMTAIIPRPMNILTLGGSTTWGATLIDRFDSYPWLIGSPNLNTVDNLALPEMGACYYALCLESYIPDSAVKNYDVILLDFVANELEGFQWLLNRLRERYPEAVLIYVHLWPLRPLIQDEGPEKGWTWIEAEKVIHKFHPLLNNGVKNAVQNAGGHFWHLNFPQEVKDARAWFDGGMWHLSEEGHIMVANGILELLFPMQESVFKIKNLGAFGKGDQCFNSFRDPSIANEAAKILPPNSSDFSDQLFLELDPSDSGEIEFESKFSVPVSVSVAYFSDRERAPIYSTAEFSIGDHQSVVVNPNHSYGSRHSAKVKYVLVGLASPGNNVLNIAIQGRPHKPFRLVGLILNEDLDNSKALISASLKDDLVVDQSPRFHVVFLVMYPFIIDYNAVKAAVSATAERLSSDWKVHVITNSDEGLSQLVFSQPNVKVVDYRDAPFSHWGGAFERNYLTQGGDNIEHDRFNMFRYLLIDEYFLYLMSRGFPVTNIVTMNNGVVALENPFLVDETIDWNSIESYRIIDGAAIIWSKDGLRKFVEYYMGAYAGTREDAVEIVTQWGIQENCRPDISQLIPCADGDVMWHMDDTRWYTAWASQNTELRKG
jgi:hypothetical protein